MRIIIKESQLNLLLNEQGKNEKTLSNLEYATNKPFSCVQYSEGFSVKGVNLKTKGYRKYIEKTATYELPDEEGEPIGRKIEFVVSFHKEWGNELMGELKANDVISIRINAFSDTKRFQQITFLGDYKCSKRDIYFKIDSVNYKEEEESGNFEVGADQNSPFSPNPYSNLNISVGKEYNNLNDLIGDLNKINVNFNNLKDIVA